MNNIEIKIELPSFKLNEVLETISNQVGTYTLIDIIEIKNTIILTISVKPDIKEFIMLGGQF